MGVLLAARLLHPLGMYARPRTWVFQFGRVGGVVLTNLVLVSSAALILLRLL
jgi:hypothetical protein